MLALAVSKSFSITGVLREIGLKMAGGSHSHISRLIREYHIDTSHFLGSASNTGSEKKGGPPKKKWHEILVKREFGKRTASVRLRRALIESGVPYQCFRCSNPGTWQGADLMLQVNHRDGNWLDDQRDNLEFLCPNCHSQTLGWCGSKGLAEVASVAKQCRAQRVRRSLK